MKTKTSIAVVFSLIALGVSCASRPSCEDLLPERLRSLDFPAISHDGPETWIARNLNATQEAKVEHHLLVGGANSWKWKDEKRDYDLVVGADGKSVRLGYQYSIPWPTGNEVVACFGPPQSYRATNIDVRQAFELWYPDRGWIFGGSGGRRYQAGDILAEFPISGVTLSSPGGQQSVAANARLFLDSDGLLDLLRELRPWPSDMAQITVTMRGGP
jgi:hypothetical protein